MSKYVGCWSPYVPMIMEMHSRGLKPYDIAAECAKQPLESNHWGAKYGAPGSENVRYIIKRETMPKPGPIPQLTADISVAMSLARIATALEKIAGAFR